MKIDSPDQGYRRPSALISGSPLPEGEREAPPVRLVSHLALVSM